VQKSQVFSPLLNERKRRKPSFLDGKMKGKKRLGKRRPPPASISNQKGGKKKGKENQKKKRNLPYDEMEVMMPICPQVGKKKEKKLVRRNGGKCVRQHREERRGLTSAKKERRASALVCRARPP